MFDDTLEFLYRNRITTATFNILTPYPGTRLYRRLKQEGRLISENWSHYNHDTVTFCPKNMTERELAEGYFYLKKEFYSLNNICQRITRLSEISYPGLAQFIYVVFNNIAGKQTLIDTYNPGYACLKDLQLSDLTIVLLLLDKTDYLYIITIR